MRFEMTEKMEGYNKIGDKRNKIEFEANWGPPNLKDFISPKHPSFAMCNLDGFISVEGLCKSSYIQGYLHLNYLENEIVYAFVFEGDDGNRYKFVGTKSNIKLWNLPTSHTTCSFVITGSKDKVVSRGVVFFKVKNAWDFIRSFRIIFSPNKNLLGR